MFFDRFFKAGKDDTETDRLLRSHPRDAHGRVIYLDDEVVLGGRVLQVVAMSHKGMIYVRKPGSTGRGGKWVDSRKAVLRDGGER